MILSASTIFLSAFLLFQVQPMIAKMILPWFGGSAAVWITAMLFFQLTLLGGYLYAHWSIRSLRPRAQAILHACLLVASLLFLPVSASVSWKPAGDEDPILRILGLLASSVGAPFFLLSSTSPLVQAWHSRRNGEVLPYRLFGLSNLASLLGLLAYPFLVEPRATLQQQSLAWSAAYVLFAALCALLALPGRETAPAGQRPAYETANDDPPSRGDKVRWALLAGCASLLLLAITNHLTQNVASIPFLWVLPLALYLLTFILTFDFEQLYRPRLFAWLAALGLGSMAYGLSHWNSHTRLTVLIPTFSAGLFACCMYFHGELVRRKPSPRHLTAFYLMLSAGGALGGVLVGVAAPLLLPGTFELPAALAAAGLLMMGLLDYRKWRLTVAVCAAAAVAALIAAGYFVHSYRDSARVMARNFYGGLRVQEYGKGGDDEVRMLVHGTVDHGMQFMLPGRRREHVTYYGPESGVGLALQSFRRPDLRIGVIGLGAGSLASFVRPGGSIRFYEINPEVERLARSEFTYLADSPGPAEVVIGDGRLSLEREQPRRFDLLAVDAFSGDAVPVHLLTKQAVELYFRHLVPHGILALHITNTHLDLIPVVEQLGRELRKSVTVIANNSDPERRIYRSTWALLSSEPLRDPAILEAAEDIQPREDLRTWTDDYNNLFQIMK